MGRNLAPAISLVAYCAALLLTPAIAHAVPTTLDFTGVVKCTKVTFCTAPIGSSITGTLTFDYAAADPSISWGTVGAPEGWMFKTKGGSSFGAPVPTNSILQTTVSAAANLYSYATPSPGIYSSESNAGVWDGVFTASEQQYPVRGITYFSSMVFFGLGSSRPFDSAGLPVLYDGVGSYGYFYAFGPGWIQEYDFFFTSLSPDREVPEPSTLALLALGLTGLGFSRRRKRN